MACVRWWFPRCSVNALQVVALLGFSLVLAEPDSSYNRYDDLSRSQHSLESPSHFIFSDIEDNLFRRHGRPEEQDVVNSSSAASDTSSPDQARKSSVVTPITESSNSTSKYYNSTLTIDEAIGRSYWVDMDNNPGVTVDKLLSNSHRRLTKVMLSFDFPFFGHKVRNVTVATGGFLYTGDYVHSWLAATQYIAPLMAHFDTRISNESSVRYVDNGTAFTAEWRKVVLKDNQDAGAFTFQATLHQNGDIVFMYSELPLVVEDLKIEQHPVKIGISDAFTLEGNHTLSSRGKTFYLYDRVDFNYQNVKNWTVIYMHALSTCVMMNNCNDCVSKLTAFDCEWCPSINWCSSSTDRLRPEWLANKCESSCPSTETTNEEDEDAATQPVSRDHHSPYYRYDYLPSSDFEDNFVRRRRSSQDQAVTSSPPLLGVAIGNSNLAGTATTIEASNSSVTPAPVSPDVKNTSKNTNIRMADPINPLTGKANEETTLPEVHEDKPKEIAKGTTSSEKPVESVTKAIPIDQAPNLTNGTLEENKITESVNDTHRYYNSTFMSDEAIAKSYWINMSDHPRVKVNELLSESHRRAATVKLSFDFPFYGHKVRNVTVATGGFLYTGEYVHSWLAATQYIAPLMANFDTRMSNVSFIKYVDNGTAFTVEWEKVVLQEKEDAGAFTFQATLLMNGDIIFVYSEVPLAVKDIRDKQHPVKVGLSDAYIMDRTIIFVRRKTIYEYHRVNLENKEIKNWTAIYLRALPTCVTMDNCKDCVSKLTDFKCKWCPSINRCSTGTDRHTQEWSVKGCENNNIDVVETCPSNSTTTKAPITNRDGENQTSSHNTLKQPPDNMRMSVAGVFGILVAVALIAGLVAWVAYAYRYPHSTSGQMLIRYRPSQWSWRRGEARYTAATIHM